MAQAGQRGVVVELVLFCPLYEDSMWDVSPMNVRNNVNGVGDVARTDVLALKDARLTEVQDAMVRKIVRVVQSFSSGSHRRNGGRFREKAPDRPELGEWVDCDRAGESADRPVQFPLLAAAGVSDDELEARTRDRQ